MKKKLISALVILLITGFCSVFSFPLGIPFWKGLILSILSGLFTMGVVLLIDIIAKLFDNGKQNSETI